jgi:purine-binding chemotaxis protein CheW
LAALLNAGAPPVPPPLVADVPPPAPAAPRPPRPVAERLAAGERVPMLRFVLGGAAMLAPLDMVREAVDAPEVHPVPQMPSHTRGVVAVRGALVPARDAAALLGVAPATAGVALVVMHDDRRVALLADDVLDTVTVQASDLRPLPGTGGRDGLALGAVPVGGRLALVVDVSAVLSALASSDP